MPHSGDCPRPIGAHDEAMRRLATPLVLTAFLASLAGLARADEPPSRPDCVAVNREIRTLGYGYNHIVVVTNRCDQAVICQVSTDVDPTPEHTVNVARGAVERVTVRVGSPASPFEPRARCERTGPRSGHRPNPDA
jgi:hypothetical protein